MLIQLLMHGNTSNHSANIYNLVQHAAKLSYLDLILVYLIIVLSHFAIMRV